MDRIWLQHLKAAAQHLWLAARLRWTQIARRIVLACRTTATTEDWRRMGVRFVEVLKTIDELEAFYESMANRTTKWTLLRDASRDTYWTRRARIVTPLERETFLAIAHEAGVLLSFTPMSLLPEREGAPDAMPSDQWLDLLRRTSKPMVVESLRRHDPGYHAGSILSVVNASVHLCQRIGSKL